MSSSGRANLGISNSGKTTELLFRELTGAVPAEKASLGDAVLDGHHVEIKAANSPTLNQVRAVKYITLVAFFVPDRVWYVIPANEIVRQCAEKKRGQHTENPFESATLSLKKLQERIVADPRGLGQSVRDARSEADQYPGLRQLMERILGESKELAARSVSEVNAALRDYGL